MSKIIESLRGDLAALHGAGAIGKVTMRKFDAICPPLKLLNVIADKGLQAIL